MIYDGRNGGTVEVLENVIIIRRKGVVGLLTQGLKGEKRIPFSSITSVQFKEPGLTTGYIQFGIMGGTESRGGVFDATTDENTVLFLARALDEFRELRNIVESKIGQPARPSATSPVSIATFTEELTRLADLRDRGVLTEEEFAEEKLRLQNQRASGAVPPSNSMPAMPVVADVSTSGRERLLDKSDKKSSKLGKGCLILLGIFIALAVLGGIVSPDKEVESSAPANVDIPTPAKKASSVVRQEKPVEESEPTGLTAQQSNAVRSAEQYLNMSGFSKKGLINQLSSDAGDGYSVSDAKAAVESLTVDWNENAARSAQQYLSMSGFSCNGLIEQLSSSAGDGYTVAQATYGARQAGAC